jgi:hypothetical protein
MPLNYAHKLGNEFRHCARNGMVAAAFDSLTGQFSTQGPTLYVLARLHVRPDWPVDKVLQEYYDGFGDAASAVQQYCEHWERVYDAVTLEKYKQSTDEVGGASYSSWYKVAPCIFTPEVMATGSDLLTIAEARARGDRATEKRVEYLRMGLTHVQLTLDVCAGQQKYKETGDIMDFAMAIKKLDDYRVAVESEGIANMGWLGFCENRHVKEGGWDRNAARRARGGW